MAVRTGTIYSAKNFSASFFFGKIKKKYWPIVKNWLILIGRPFYWGLLASLLAALWLTLTIGKISLFLIKILFFLGNILVPLFYASLLKIILFALTLLRFRPGLKFPKLPKVRLSKIRKVKIVLLKLKLLLIFPVFLFFSFSVFLFYSQILKDLPSPDRLISRNQIVSTKIYDRSGKLLYKIYRNQNRTLVKLEDIPLFLRQATIAIEDAEFYNHHGLSLKGILRASRKILQTGKIEGGSTITQQLVKNALLSPERTFKRKIKEVLLSLWVERRFSKDEILQMYLNEVGFGGAAYGVEEASQFYFGKSVKEINLAEAALLAGLPASPTTYSPFGANPEKAKERQRLVLKRMVQEGFITQEQLDKAFAEEIPLSLKKESILSPHFVMYVKDILVKKYGETMVEEGGLEVKTSLDLDIQNLAQEKVSSEIEKLKPLRVTNAAALVTNPKTGEILAMVGSRDYFDLKNQGNYNVTTALRQPGSSIKPVNYAVALSMGFTPVTLIPDTPITYHLPGQPPYTPKNYDNRFHGNVSLRTALGSSYNVPAVKVLSAIGVSRMIEQGQKMGITTWSDPSNYGLSLTLGGGEVKMTDMAVVYGTLANLGVRVDLHPILEVKDYKGKTLEKLECGSRGALASSPQLTTRPTTHNSPSPCGGTPVLSPQIAYILTDILSDNSARTPAFGPNSLLNIPGYPSVAVKTGTSNNLKDNWTIGYTPEILVTVWVGNNDASPMSYVASGITGASPIWHNIMKELLKDKPDMGWEMPKDMVKVEICPLTATLACETCPNKKWEIFIAGTEPKTACSDEEIERILTRRESP